MSAKSAAEKQTSHIQSAIVVFTFHFQDATATADLPDHPEFIRKYKSDGTPNCDNDQSLTAFFALLKVGREVKHPPDSFLGFNECVN